jgi:hypothetical protein
MVHASHPAGAIVEAGPLRYRAEKDLKTQETRQFPLFTRGICSYRGDENCRLYVAT